ncbi:MAG: GTPase domain-containing protein [Burkholderiales bacterium]
MTGTVSLSLVSHTNAGKTTLARTLLGRDVGTVRDAPHVTEFADVFTMIETPQGDQLQLWDTPGFGDSVRLARRLRESGNPVGWFLGSVWDRWRDRPFWASQQALRNVRDEADVMLYLVNASESPEAAGYVKPEMEILGWVGKPVIVLLNQLGAPREPALEENELMRWRSHLQAFAPVRAVLALDAFARCWVQELTLLRAIESVLGGDARARMQRLRAGWLVRREETFGAALRALADSLARVAVAREVLQDAGGLGARLRGVGAAVARGVGMTADDATPAALAQKALAQRLDDELRANTLVLIQMHGLSGDAQGEILTRLATHYDLRLRMDETKAAMWGGMVTGALVGLKADVLSGGLTLGGGLLAGGLIGALGAAGLARCVNLVRGTDRSWITWNAEALDQMVEAALLRYLAVAHFGRGRGDWAQGESPPHWRDVVAQALLPHRETLAVIWASRGDGGEPDALAAVLQPVLDQAARAALEQLYPGSLRVA